MTVPQPYCDALRTADWLTWAGPQIASGAGTEYTIADMSAHPWTGMPERRGANLDDYPNCKRWVDQINERPAVQRAKKIGDSIRDAAANATGPIDPNSLL